MRHHPSFPLILARAILEGLFAAFFAAKSTLRIVLFWPPCGRARWGVVQPVGHLTVNEDGEGSNPSAPANFLSRIVAELGHKDVATARSSISSAWITHRNRTTTSRATCRALRATDARSRCLFGVRALIELGFAAAFQTKSSRSQKK